MATRLKAAQHLLVWRAFWWPNVLLEERTTQSQLSVKFRGKCFSTFLECRKCRCQFDRKASWALRSPSSQSTEWLQKWRPCRARRNLIERLRDDLQLPLESATRCQRFHRKTWLNGHLLLPCKAERKWNRWTQFCRLHWILLFGHREVLRATPNQCWSWWRWIADNKIHWLGRCFLFQLWWTAASISSSRASLIYILRVARWLHVPTVAYLRIHSTECWTESQRFRLEMVNIDPCRRSLKLKASPCCSRRNIRFDTSRKVQIHWKCRRRSANFLQLETTMRWLVWCSPTKSVHSRLSRWPSGDVASRNATILFHSVISTWKVLPMMQSHLSTWPVNLCWTALQASLHRSAERSKFHWCSMPLSVPSRFYGHLGWLWRSPKSGTYDWRPHQRFRSSRSVPISKRLQKVQWN